ncbi:ABC transporter substrate-binding protein [Thioclava sp. SK-1]|uniref:ABC transporter substrate-binding protein n=1 Tax=Thioclava sp. SK-1 TaxID=1889770 RepID=UPI0008256E5D|nr:ABC transporter substrate-binding protein [Thioclava sp. SK-1]OCX58145.1 ABC transporter substrate-binding protein [Thioclava sp. SK-1]
MTRDLPRDWTGQDDRSLQNALRHGASRRDLLRMLMTGGVGLAAGGTLLGAAGRSVAATPTRGGHLKAAGWSASTADTLDPAKGSNTTDYVRACTFYSRLTFINETGTPQMELAKTIKTNDAQTWYITLRSGVYFHDGKSFGSADVVYSLQRHLDPEVGSKVNAIAKQMIDITATGPLTVKIVLSEPNADLPTILGLHHFAIIADGTTDFTTANGTGPFTCTVFEPGVRSVGERNENYFKPDGPYLDSVEFFAIADTTARLNALLSGDIHIAAKINPRAMRSLEGRAGISTLTTTAGNYTDLNIRMDLDPGTKAGFIEGMKYLINREAIQKSVLRGFAEIGNDQPISAASRYYNTELAPVEFDPERARAAFKKAGLLGVEVPIVASEAAASSVDMATVIQQAGAQIGMNIKIDQVPADGYWSNYWLKAPIHFGHINPRPTPDILFSLLYTSDAPWNESRYLSTSFDRLLKEARGLTDETKRTDIYWDLQEMVAKKAGTIIPAYMSNIDAYTDKLGGLAPNPLGGLNGYAFSEYVWLNT